MLTGQDACIDLYIYVIMLPDHEGCVTWVAASKLVAVRVLYTIIQCGFVHYFLMAIKTIVSGKGET